MPMCQDPHFKRTSVVYCIWQPIAKLIG